eukprot:CAMPEP_0178414492 /NCGR_PEP_ID=MMETSP0689_2-20121128/23063_1 /TAXON_ID=160604 /ORGANISM="Amphidinium massartii, Strain CS-259" /LENGTH=377 /DNA_ID=CAMNT_0020035781 /DNA_START=114 /DNA_END=1244 /DNA_ORIENTATION=-
MSTSALSSRTPSKGSNPDVLPSTGLVSEALRSLGDSTISPRDMRHAVEFAATGTVSAFPSRTTEAVPSRLSRATNVDDPEIRRDNAVRESLLEMDIVSNQVQRTKGTIETRRGMRQTPPGRYDLSWGNLVVPGETEDIDEADLEWVERQFLEDQARKPMEESLLRCCQPNMSTLRPLVDMLPQGFEQELLQDHHNIMDYFALKQAVYDRHRVPSKQAPKRQNTNEQGEDEKGEDDDDDPRMTSKGSNSSNNGRRRARRAGSKTSLGSKSSSRSVRMRGIVLTHRALQNMRSNQETPAGLETVLEKRSRKGADASTGGQEGRSAASSSRAGASFKAAAAAVQFKKALASPPSTAGASSSVDPQSAFSSPGVSPRLVKS